MLALILSSVEMPGGGTITLTGLVAIALVAIVMGSVRKMTRDRNHEESRREIAAYVAEGTMSADDAAKILAAGKGWNGCGKT